MASVSYPSIPKRIISLVPSQTELLFDLGLAQEIVGITKFCIHPAHIRKTKTIVGGTKNFHFDVIDQLQPDLIIGNKEENYKEGIEVLQKKYPVWISDIENLADALTTIQEIGTLTDRVYQATDIAGRIETAFMQLKPILHPKKVAYFIWRKPYMVAASHTFIHAMLETCGFINIFKHLSRYPEVSQSQLKESKPDYIFLSSEPYPFQEKHIQEFKEICPEADIKLVDGEMFSWYGSRLLYSPAYFEELISDL